MAEVDPAGQVIGLASGYRIAQAVYVATALGVADRLADGPRTAAQLARDCTADEAMLARLLRLLVAYGVLAYAEPGSSPDAESFALTEVGACLRADAAEDVRSWVLMFGAEQYQAWGALLHTVTTGQPAFDTVYGMGFWDFLARQPAKARVFGAAMTESAPAWGDLVARHCDLSACTTVVDVGGGSGSALATVLSAYPCLHGILVDLPVALGDARQVLCAHAGRYTITPGSFFGSLPGGHDAYLLCRVLGDWTDAAATRILSACRHAMRPDSTLIVVGGLASARPTPLQAALDLHLSVLLGGGDRSPARYAALLRDAGLIPTRSIVDDEAGAVLVEGVRSPD